MKFVLPHRFVAMKSVSSSAKRRARTRQMSGGHRGIEFLYPFPCGIEVHVWPVCVFLVSEALRRVELASSGRLDLCTFVPFIERRNPNPTRIRSYCRLPLIVVVACPCAWLRCLGVPRADPSVDVARSNRWSKYEPVRCCKRVRRFPILRCGTPRDRAGEISI
jgi:hypothetical protein